MSVKEGAVRIFSIFCIFSRPARESERPQLQISAQNLSSRSNGGVSIREESSSFGSDTCILNIHFGSTETQIMSSKMQMIDIINCICLLFSNMTTVFVYLFLQIAHHYPTKFQDKPINRISFVCHIMAITSCPDTLSTAFPA